MKEITYKSINKVKKLLELSTASHELPQGPRVCHDIVHFSEHFKDFSFISASVGDSKCANSAEEHHVMRSKAPEQLLNRPCGVRSTSRTRLLCIKSYHMKLPFVPNHLDSVETQCASGRSWIFIPRIPQLGRKQEVSEKWAVLISTPNNRKTQ